MGYTQGTDSPSEAVREAKFSCPRSRCIGVINVGLQVNSLAASRFRTWFYDWP